MSAQRKQPAIILADAYKRCKKRRYRNDAIETVAVIAFFLCLNERSNINCPDIRVSLIHRSTLTLYLKEIPSDFIVMYMNTFSQCCVYTEHISMVFTHNLT